MRDGDGSETVVERTISIEPAQRARGPGPYAGHQHLVVGLELQALKILVGAKATKGTGIERRIHAAIWIEPSEIVSRCAIHVGELAADPDFSIPLHGHAGKAQIGITLKVTCERAVNLPLLIEARNQAPGVAVHRVELAGEDHLAVWL